MYKMMHLANMFVTEEAGLQFLTRKLQNQDGRLLLSLMWLL
jgi:hypothetical protein